MLHYAKPLTNASKHIEGPALDLSQTENKNEMSERDKVCIYDLGVVWPPLFSYKKTLLFHFFSNRKTQTETTRASNDDKRSKKKKKEKTSKINNEILISRRYHTERIKTLKDGNASSAKKNIIKIRYTRALTMTGLCRLRIASNLKPKQNEMKKKKTHTKKNDRNRKCLSTIGVLENVSKTKSDKM